MEQYVYVLVSWMNPSQDIEVLDVFDSKEAVEQYIDNKKLNRKYCDYTGYRVKKVIGV